MSKNLEEYAEKIDETTAVFDAVDNTIEVRLVDIRRFTVPYSCDIAFHEVFLQILLYQVAVLDDIERAMDTECEADQITLSRILGAIHDMPINNICTTLDY